MKIDLVPVVTKKQQKTFIDFPHDLYADDPNYVPELYISQKEMFDRKKYPFYEYGDALHLLASKEGKIVGRIAAIENKNYNQYHNSNVGFFGFFDVVNDHEVAGALLDAAAKWVKSRSFDAMIGPTNFTTNETAGVLVDGFDSPPKIMMTYNYPYYEKLLVQYGFKKEMDLYAYFIKSEEASDKYLRFAGTLEERLKKKGIQIRKMNMKKFKEEVAKIKEVYNKAWEKNWGFVPFTDAEFKHLASGLKMLADPDWCYLAEKEGKPIGFGVTLPDINEVLIDIKRGRLFPFGIFKLLWRKNKVNSVRVLALGVLEEYRSLGIAAIFFAWNIRESRKRKMLGGEASWILENNVMMRNAADHMNGKIYKTYRLYRYSL